VEYLVVIVAFLLGYWAVAAFLENKAPKDSVEGNWFRILGVEPDASADQIAAAYKAKISQYHPDKVAGMGAEIRAVAEAKSKEINTAYDYALRLRSAMRS